MLAPIGNPEPRRALPSLKSPTASGLAQKVHRTLFPDSRNLLKRGGPLLKSSPLLPGFWMLSPSIPGSSQGGSASPSSPPPRGCGPLYPHKTNGLELSSLGTMLGALFLCKPFMKSGVYPFITPRIKVILGAAGYEKRPVNFLSLTGFIGKYLDSNCSINPNKSDTSMVALTFAPVAMHYSSGTPAPYACMYISFLLAVILSKP